MCCLLTLPKELGCAHRQVVAHFGIVAHGVCLGGVGIHLFPRHGEEELDDELAVAQVYHRVACHDVGLRVAWRYGVDDGLDVGIGFAWRSWCPPLYYRAEALDASPAVGAEYHHCCTVAHAEAAKLTVALLVPACLSLPLHLRRIPYVQRIVTAIG